MRIEKDFTERRVFTREEVEKSTLEYFKGDSLATTVWIDKYSLKEKITEIGKETVKYYELNPDMMHRRIAAEFARAESKYVNPMSEEEIYNLLKDFEYIVPQGSPMAGIGNPFVNTSISNCFLIGNQPDSYGGIMNADEEQVQLMKRRGGVGQDLSFLRPSGATAGGAPLGESCGMTLYMDRYSNSTREVQQDGRRGALMLSVSIHHPDAEKFIDKKMMPGSVTGANVSVKITDAFMEAQQANKPFFQVFPIEREICDVLNIDKSYLHQVEHEYKFDKLYTIITKDGEKVYFKKVDPKRIWDKLCHNAWKSAEPGILFWDRVLEESPCVFYGSSWEEKGTNPCFTGDTLVAVADAREYVSLRELAERGEDVEVYSESPNGVIAVKTMRNIRLVAEKQRIFTITLNNGEKIKATKNHKFYLKNNEVVEMKDLKKGQHLKPITKFRDSRGLAILNKDSRVFGNMPTLSIKSIKETGVESVYNGTVDDYHNYFIGKFTKEQEKNPVKIGSSIKTKNCGEIPLPPYDSCRLLLLNLYGYVSNKFTKDAVFEDDLFLSHVSSAMRLMDDVVDLEIEKIDLILEEIKSKSFDGKFQKVEFDLWTKIRQKAIDGRRTGLGVTGEGDMMAALGIKYGTPEGTLFSEKLHQLLATQAYVTSIDLAEERGAFPICDPRDVESSKFLQRILSEETNELITQDDIARHEQYGRRNIAILTIAPAGSVSLMTQTTSGVECAFSMWYFRKKKVTTENYHDYVDEVGDKWVEFPVFHDPFIHYYAALMGASYEDAKESLSHLKEEALTEIFKGSPYFEATSRDVDYVEKVRMQGAIQKWVDHSISVTVNMPEDVTEQMVNDVYKQAFSSGCKGVTVYRDNSRGNVLSTTSDKNKEDKEDFEYQHAIKRAKSLEADVFFKTSKGMNFVILVGKVEDKPYEVFTISNLTLLDVTTSKLKKMKSGLLIKQKKGIYDFADSEGEILIQDLGSYMVENEQNSTRLISSLLRHRADPDFVAEQILKFATINSFHQVIAKALQSYSKSGERCPECKSQMIKAEGCKKCPECGYNACN